jgi:UDP-N-acetylmuramate--alanine ligase
VYTSAISRQENPEFLAATKRGIRTLRRAEFMGELLQGLQTIAVAGTHGKTTTTSMIAAILIEAKLDPVVLAGATVKELGNRNARAGKGNLAVVEADEFDRSFLSLKPYIAVMTSLEAEHLDIYKDIEDLKHAFTQFANQGATGFSQGFAVVSIDDPHLREITPQLEKRIVSYGISAAEAKYRATNIEVKPARTKATLWRGSEVLGELELGVPGEHNIKNALAAIAVAEILAIPFESTKKALKKFTGAERRFQIKGEAGGVLVIDDYAHHPTEVRVTLDTVRRAYPSRRIVACFQPHTFSRTRDFATEFGEAFAAGADVLELLEIYQAREEPIPGVSSTRILDAAMEAGLKEAEIVQSLEALPDRVAERAEAGDIVLTMGAGTITEAAPLIVEKLREKFGIEAVPAGEEIARV